MSELYLILVDCCSTLVFEYYTEWKKSLNRILTAWFLRKICAKFAA